MRGINDERQPVLGGHRRQRRHVARIAEVVAGRDGDRARRDGGRHGLRRDVRRARIDVDEHWPQVVPDDRGGPREESEAGDDDLAERLTAGAAPDRAKSREPLHRTDGTRASCATAVATTAGRQVEALVDEQQTDRATAHRDRVPDAQPRRDSLLQAVDERPLCEPAAGDDLGRSRPDRLPRRQSWSHERHANADGSGIAC